jgi:hypothetical protein
VFATKTWTEVASATAYLDPSKVPKARTQGAPFKHCVAERGSTVAPVSWLLAEVAEAGSIARRIP